MPNAEDSVLDLIDELVDDSLARGDQSDSFHGEQYDRCTWCGQTWHYLGITLTMQQMRAGSYGRDEFGQGVFDPDYVYAEDTSPLACPGSEWVGPPTNDREWAWAKQRWGRPYAAPAAHVGPTLPTGRISIWRFSGPFDGWEITLDDTRELEDTHYGLPDAPYVRDRSRPPSTRVVSQTLTATFDLERPIRVESLENPVSWFAENGRDVLSTTWTSDGTFHEMAAIVIPFRSFRVQGDPNNVYPDYIEFETTYDVIARHPWAAAGWERQIPMHPSEYERQGYESDYVIIDETHEHTNREVQEYVDSVQEVTRSLAAQTAIPATFLEAPGERERRPEVLRGAQEDTAGPYRSMAAEEYARRVQEAIGAAFDASFPPSGEAGSTGS